MSFTTALADVARMVKGKSEIPTDADDAQEWAQDRIAEVDALDEMVGNLVSAVSDLRDVLNDLDGSAAEHATALEDEHVARDTVENADEEDEDAYADAEQDLIDAESATGDAESAQDDARIEVIDRIDQLHDVLAEMGIGLPNA